MATSKMYILRKTQKLKNIISYFTITFYIFVLKIETGWATRMIKPILKARNVIDDMLKPNEKCLRCKQITNSFKQMSQQIKSIFWEKRVWVSKL